MSDQGYDIKGYDIIGDIHGHADALRRLLTKLGYSDAKGVFRRPGRKVIFVGDFVDRGPEQREVLRIARTMCEAETAFAVLGNHEFNAIGWATPDRKDGFLRAHSEKNKSQHREFLEQFKEGSPEYRDAIRWFRDFRCGLSFLAFAWFTLVGTSRHGSPCGHVSIVATVSQMRDFAKLSDLIQKRMTLRKC